MTSPLPEYEEWRLVFEVPEDGPKASTFANALRNRLPPRIDVHRTKGREIRVYAGTRADIDHALKIIGQELAARQTQTRILLSRWNPGGERWQEPSLPVETPSTPLPDAWSALDEFAWEVRLRFEIDWEMFRLVDGLRDEGLAVLEGWKCCLIALPDEATARRRAEELRKAAPRAELEVRPLSRFRKWQIRQRVFGNYAEGADVGGPQSP